MLETATPCTGLITVGVKILAGVSIASNLFIGTLLYVNIHSSTTVENMVNEVLTIREQLSSNLRGAIVSLQDELLALPDFFRIDPRAPVTKAIQTAFTVTDRQLLKGRTAYSGLYSRNERRDLAKNQYLVQVVQGRLIVSSGVADANGNFSDSVERLTLASTNPAEDETRLRSLIATVSAETNSSTAITGKIRELGAKIADSSLEAEETRNEILQHVEEIRAKEADLETLRRQQRRFTIAIGIMAIVANMAVLYILVRLIIEKPLRRLTGTIEEIRSGRSPQIPYLQRKDQIGVLAGAITNFHDALTDIRRENIRKSQEKLIIEEMFTDITSVVNSLETKARDLVHTADTLQGLATSTEEQSESVTQRAGDTAEHTNMVSDSTIRLQSAFQEIQAQIGDQNAIVSHILESNSHSRKYMNALNESIGSIHTIISAVGEITDQTKLLALNATIEAARAGAAGKGFAVVASEVKELSYKTEQATDDVMSKIRAIEKASSVLFAHLDSIDERMQSLNQLTGNITCSVADQQQVTDNIAHLAGQTHENTRTVSTSSIEVRGAAGRTRDLAGQVHDFSSEISAQLTRLLEDTTTRLNKLTASGRPDLRG